MSEKGLFKDAVRDGMSLSTYFFQLVLLQLDDGIFRRLALSPFQISFCPPLFLVGEYTQIFSFERSLLEDVLLQKAERSISW